jgi:molecular chaperone HtpG
MMTEEKFWDKAKEFALFKNTEGKYFTYDEYRDHIKESQTDQNKTIVYLYASDNDAQFSYIRSARDKGYDVLLMDGQFDTHFLNHLEEKFEKSHFVRVDSDVVDKLIQKDTRRDNKLEKKMMDWLSPVFKSQLPGDGYYVTFESLDEYHLPVTVTQSEWTRRMKEMSKFSGGMNFYKDLPESLNLVINTNHPVIMEIAEGLKAAHGVEADKIDHAISGLKEDQEALQTLLKGKKEDEIAPEEKDKRTDLENQIMQKENERDQVLSEFGSANPVVKQVIDLALLATNRLTGESLDAFVKRSIQLLGKL